jgi:pantoate--beta-alanine ligase
VKVLRTKESMRAWSRERRGDGDTIAFVPTMGGLHEGHLSLVRAARDLADHVVVSIYVNPTQFAPDEDFGTYPRSEARDLAELGALGVAAVFVPETLYEDSQTWIRVTDLDGPLCGESRPHFFRGVATVVAKLFHLVEPDVAVFGDKDFQQRRVIEQMVADLDMAVRIVGMPIVREADGLAMSSRNQRLDSDARKRAVALSESLELAASQIAAGEQDAAKVMAAMAKHIESAGGKIDYVALVDPETLADQTRITGPIRAAVAAHFGGVRLIDNRAI